MVAAIIMLRGDLKARPGTRGLDRIVRASAELAPHIVAGVTFLSGALLFPTGAIPAERARLAWLADVVPLALIEASQFLGSLVGAALLLVAWGLERRIRLAFQMASMLFAAGALLALARSMDIHVASVLAVGLVVLLLARRAFAERTARLAEPMGGAWAFFIGATLLVSVWLGWARHRYASATGAPWWQFTVFGDAPAHVRAAVAAVSGVLLFTLGRLLVRARPTGGESPETEAQRVAGPD